MGKVKTALLTFAKAQCSAWIASAADFAATLLLSEVVGLWYAYATFIGAIVGGATNCFINYRWVFQSFDQKKKYIALKYLFVWTVSIVLNTYATVWLTESTGWNFIICKIIVACAVAVCWNYQMQSQFVFHNLHKKKDTTQNNNSI